MKENNSFECVRHDDLVAFLYNEMPDSEARAFRNHLLECSSCENQLSAFSNVREQVVAWRDESLGAMSSLTPESAPAIRVPARPSAIAALREFFNLSPAWMKGATAFASLLFCLLAVLTVARLMETPTSTPTSTLVKNQTNNASSEQQINAIVERRVQEALQKQQTLVATEVGQQPSPILPTVSRRSSATRPVTDKARRPLTKVERQELAADLRLINLGTENEPQLLSDQINQD